MLEKAQWEREKERGLGFCYLELGGAWGGSEKRGARVFRVWLWLDLYTNSEEENGKKLKGDFVNSRKKGPWAYIRDSRATTLSVG